MIARVLVVAALVALLAGCGGSGHNASPPTTTTKPKPKPKPKPKHHASHKMTKLVVTILDGDRRTRVRGAKVSLWGRSGRTDRHGVTTIVAPRGRHEVSVSKRGYGPARELVDFQRSRWQTVDVYQPDLQWPLYGATEARTQAPTEIRLRPPFRLVWSRGLGHLIEFPAVVADGFAYIGNARGTIRAISMRDGKFAWAHLTPGFPRMASSPAVYGNQIVYHTHERRGVPPEPRQRSSRVELERRLGDRVVADRRERDRLLRHRERRDVRARPAHAPGEVAQVSRREDHLERRDRRRQALHRGLQRPALGTLTGVRCDSLGRPGGREDLRDARGGRRQGVRARPSRTRSGPSPRAGGASGGSRRARTSTRRPPSRTVSSASARTTASSTGLRPGAVASSGASRPAVPSRERP